MVRRLKQARTRPFTATEAGREKRWLVRARRAKRNEQLAPSRTATGIAKLVEERLRAHPVIAAYARPSAFARIQVNRYAEGMQYGWHVDDAHIGGMRTDLSFTCFLSAPDDYDGGELVVTESAGERRIKLPAGDCFVYPADTVHLSLIHI